MRPCWGAGHHYREDDEGETDLHGIERTKDQPPDAEPDLRGDVGRAELQRSFQKRDGQHPAKPDEGDSDGDRWSGAHFAAVCSFR